LRISTISRRWLNGKLNRQSPGAEHVKTTFLVALPEGLEVNGVIQVDQIKSLDWQARNAEFWCVMPDEMVYEVLEKVGVLLQIL